MSNPFATNSKDTAGGNGPQCYHTKIQDLLICMNASTGCSEKEKSCLAQTTVVMFAICVLHFTGVIMWLMSFHRPHGALQKDNTL